MPANSLSLPESLLLLALDDEKGKVSWSIIPYLDYALAGAILAELILAGLITLTPDSKNLVTTGAGSPPDSPILLEALSRFTQKNPPENLSGWVTDLSTMENLSDRFADQLTKKGILKKDKEHFLLVFPVVRYPLLNQTAEKEIIDRMADAIRGDGLVNHRVALLIGFARSLHLLNRVITQEELEQYEERIAQIIKADKDVICGATTELIHNIERAMYVASSVPFMSIGRI